SSDLSAVCVAGLVVVDPATAWSPFGQVVILGLVQVGGFGFMTGSTLLLLLFVDGRIGLRDRILAQASTGGLELGGVLGIVRRIALFPVRAPPPGPGPDRRSRAWRSARDRPPDRPLHDRRRGRRRRRAVARVRRDRTRR